MRVRWSKTAAKFASPQSRNRLPKRAPAGDDTGAPGGSGDGDDGGDSGDGGEAGGVFRR